MLGENTCSPAYTGPQWDGPIEQQPANQWIVDVIESNLSGKTLMSDIC